MARIVCTMKITYSLDMVKSFCRQSCKRENDSWENPFNVELLRRRRIIRWNAFAASSENYLDKGKEKHDFRGMTFSLLDSLLSDAVLPAIKSRNCRKVFAWNLGIEDFLRSRPQPPLTDPFLSPKIFFRLFAHLDVTFCHVTTVWQLWHSTLKMSSVSSLGG